MLPSNPVAPVTKTRIEWGPHEVSEGSGLKSSFVVKSPEIIDNPTCAISLETFFNGIFATIKGPTRGKSTRFLGCFARKSEITRLAPFSQAIDNAPPLGPICWAKETVTAPSNPRAILFESLLPATHRSRRSLTKREKIWDDGGGHQR